MGILTNWWVMYHQKPQTKVTQDHLPIWNQIVCIINGYGSTKTGMGRKMVPLRMLQKVDLSQHGASRLYSRPKLLGHVEQQSQRLWL